MKIPVLVTSLIYNKEQEIFTRECIASLESDKHLLDVRLDSRNCKNKLTQKWNDFCDEFRGTDYTYLLIIANDTIAKKESIDDLVKFMDDNPTVGIGESRLNRNKDDFLGTKYCYLKEPDFAISDTSNFIIRKGVIEKVGRFNEERYPFAYNERDYIYRCKLAGITVATTQMALFYHPPVSLTLENRGDFNSYVKAYKEQWGGDWQQEKFTTPFNFPVLDYTFSENSTKIV